MRVTILNQLNGLAVIYDREVTKDLVDIWCAVLSDLSEEEIIAGVTTYVRNDNPFFPKPGQIYALIRPQQNGEQEATLIAERIISQLGPNGGPSEFNAKRAKLRIGEIGWKYIQEYRNGWAAFSDSFDEDTNLETAKSQIRKGLMSLLIDKNASMTLLANGESQRNLASFGLEMRSINGTREQAAVERNLSEDPKQ